MIKTMHELTPGDVILSSREAHNDGIFGNDEYPVLIVAITFSLKKKENLQLHYLSQYGLSWTPIFDSDEFTTLT
jgi:hypothetical protein